MANRGSNQNRLPPPPAVRVAISLPFRGPDATMLATAAARSGELSTLWFRPRAREHNQRMNESSASGLGRFLTLADTAEVLNISVHQAYGLVRSGELAAIKIGGHGQWRVERSILEAFIEAKYEETRRMNLWNQADFDNIPELSFERRSE